MESATYFGVSKVDVEVVKTIVCDDDGRTLTDGDKLIAGAAITYQYVVTNNTNVDLTGVSLKDDKLTDVDEVFNINAGATLTFTQTGTAGGSGLSTNTATVSASFTDACGNSDSDSDVESATYFGANVQIDVEKYVSVDGLAWDDPGKVWEDADNPTGPALASTQGIDPVFKYVVVNKSNVDLANVVLSDNMFDIGGLGGKSVEIGTLLAGDGMADTASDDGDAYTLYFSSPWQPGQHSNTATATGTFTDSCGNTESATDSDMAHYFGTTPGIITNSSLCTFDTDANREGSQFNLNFTPQFNYHSGNYKLSSSNPGQFYYNIFWNGPADTDKANVVLKIPQPFQLFKDDLGQPIHVYDYADIATGVDGQYCLDPQGLMASYSKADITVEQKDGFNIYTIKGVPTGGDGSFFLNVHLDYGYKGNIGYERDPSTNAAVDRDGYPGSLASISDNTTYAFSHSFDDGIIQGGAVYNNNQFKKITGVGASILMDGSRDPITNQTLYLTDKTGKQIIDVQKSDADGWTFMTKSGPRKPADYKLYWDIDRNGLSAKDPSIAFQWGGNQQYFQATFLGHAGSNGLAFSQVLAGV